MRVCSSRRQPTALRGRKEYSKEANYCGRPCMACKYKRCRDECSTHSTWWGGQRRVFGQACDDLVCLRPTFQSSDSFCVFIAVLLMSFCERSQDPLHTGVLWRRKSIKGVAAYPLKELDCITFPQYGPPCSSGRIQTT